MRQSWHFTFIPLFVSICVNRQAPGIMKTHWGRQKTYLRTCAPSKDSDQPAHSRSLIRIFTRRILDSQGDKVSSCGQQKLWSDCADAQTDLSLRWVLMSEGTFSLVAAYLCSSISFTFNKLETATCNHRSYKLVFTVYKKKKKKERDASHWLQQKMCSG